MKLVTIVGARPQFVKAAPLSAALRTRHREVLVHTGQHYDRTLSRVFFEELGIPAPDYHLGIGSGSHATQTAAMLEAIERVLLAERPDAVIVYGDTNSTLAGALAAAKLHVPVAHVEAGLRSFNRKMPEEVNRVLTDHVSTWLFTPSGVARDHLAHEGITRGVHVVGDIMVDALRLFGPRAASHSGILARLALQPRGFYLATVHRAENTDAPERLSAIFAGLQRLNAPVILPLHPRTRERMCAFAQTIGGNLRVLNPVGYLDMLQLQQSAAGILTDSGGIQKEAYFFGVPCVTLRDETEWVETIASGWNQLAGADPDRIEAAARQTVRIECPRPPVYGDGHAAQGILAALSTA